MSDDCWENAWDMVKVDWSECNAGIVCPCGEELVVSDESDEKECQCGRVYRMLSAPLQVKQPQAGTE